jgi:hypothetical protein
LRLIGSDVTIWYNSGMDPTPPPLPSPALVNRRQILAWIGTGFGLLLMFGGLVGCVAGLGDSGYWHIRAVEYHPLLDRPPGWDLIPPPTPASIYILIFAAGFHLVILAQILLAVSRPTR